MIVEIECPSCGVNHFFDVALDVAYFVIPAGVVLDDELLQIVVEHVKVKGMVPAHVIEENI
jgi:hypothetical protein